MALAKDVSIGYVLVGPKNDGGWSMRHDQGFQSLKKHGHTVEGVESVAESDSERVFKKLSSEARSGFWYILWVHGEYGTRRIVGRRPSFSTRQGTKVTTQTWTTMSVTHSKLGI